MFRFLVYKQQHTRDDDEEEKEIPYQLVIGRVSYDEKLEAPKQITIGSQCAGLGAAEMGIEKHDKFKTRLLWASEQDEGKQKLYRHIHGPDFTMYEWVSETVGKAQPVDVVVAGFPCQPFSTCGEHGGFADSRGTVIHEIVEGLETMSPKPRVVLLENVKGLVTQHKEEFKANG